MKKLVKIKLNQLSKSLMEKRELINLYGGYDGGDKCCQCGCHYQDQGGSSDYDNLNANYEEGLSSSPPIKGCSYEPGPGTHQHC